MNYGINYLFMRFSHSYAISYSSKNMKSTPHHKTKSLFICIRHFYTVKKIKCFFIYNNAHYIIQNIYETFIKMDFSVPFIKKILNEFFL